MKEYEIVSNFSNGCAGAAHPQTHFEEAELNRTDAFVRTKHGKDFVNSLRSLRATGGSCTPTTTAP